MRARLQEEQPRDAVKSFRTAACNAGGLCAAFEQVVHCLAAEPRETILRLVVLDGETELAYETAVLGALRPGYRSFQMRSIRTGTRIELCSLLVHITLGEEKNLWADAETLRCQIVQQEVMPLQRCTLMTGSLARSNAVLHAFPS